MKTRTKKVRRTSAPRTARKPKASIDPRLQRVLDVVEEMFDREADGNSGADGFVAALWTAVHGYVSDRKGVRLLLTTAIKAAGRDGDAALDRLLEIASNEHQSHCACCRAHAEVRP